jgi:hypothetical protein
MLSFMLWLVLLFLCWPLALLALVPIRWLADYLPFRLIGIGVEGVFELLRAIVCCRRASCAARPLKVYQEAGA